MVALLDINPSIPSGEAARRYCSAKQFLYSGVPHVYLPQFWTPYSPFSGPPRTDYKFFDLISPPNIWDVYTNQPLREGRFVNFPITTSFEQNQPRLLLVNVDVEESAAVTFDSYPKDDKGAVRESKYPGGHYEYTINYPLSIKSDYVMTSASVPLNYDYAKISDVNKFDKQSNSSSETRYFWDGGTLSNTPLRE